MFDYCNDDSVWAIQVKAREKDPDHPYSLCPNPLNPKFSGRL